MHFFTPAPSLQPTNNKFFETFSFLPPLSSDQIARQVDYIVNNGWTPCLEISDADSAYTSNDNCVRLNGCTPVSATLRLASSHAQLPLASQKWGVHGIDGGISSHAGQRRSWLRSVRRRRQLACADACALASAPAFLMHL